MNGRLVIDGAGKPLVYDNDIVPSTSRYKIEDVLSGNIGKADSFDFASNVGVWPENETTAPLSLDQVYDIINREQSLKSVHSGMQSTTASSLTSASSRAKTVSGVSFDRVFSITSTEAGSGVWELDIGTGAITNAPPRIVDVVPEAPRVDSFSDIFHNDLYNAPLHFPIQHVFDNNPWGEENAFFQAIAYQFTPEDNLWSQEIQLQDQSVDWALVANVLFEHNRGMENHLGISLSDEYISVVPQNNNLNRFDSSAFYSFSFPSALS